MKYWLRTLILILLPLTILSGCTVATPEVKKLFSSLNSFRLQENDLRIPSLGMLSSITVNASCNSLNTGFEYELPSAPGTWVPVPATASLPFTSITNDCETTRSLQLVLDLSGMAPFSSMLANETHTIRFRDVNSIGLTVTEEFRITYSIVTLSDGRLVYGQGFNNTKQGRTHLLQGRVLGLTRQNSIPGSGTHSLQGRVIVE